MLLENLAATELRCAKIHHARVFLVLQIVLLFVLHLDHSCFVAHPTTITKLYKEAFPVPIHVTALEAFTGTNVCRDAVKVVRGGKDRVKGATRFAFINISFPLGGAATGFTVHLFSYHIRYWDDRVDTASVRLGRSFTCKLGFHWFHRASSSRRRQFLFIALFLTCLCWLRMLAAQVKF